MESKVNHTLVGLFVIILGAALMAAILWLTVGIEGKVYDTYRVYTRESVSGLNPKATVKYKGVEVGQVTTIELDPKNPQQVELTLEIERGTPIREDTQAVLTVQGLTGLAYVELTGGSREAPPLEPTPENPVPVIESGPSLVARLDEAFTETLTTFTRLSGQLETILSEENRAALSQTLTHMEEITATVAANSDVLGKGLKSAALTLENSAQVSTELPPMLARINTSIAAMEKTALAITQTSQSLNQVVLESRQDLQQVTQNLAPELTSLLSELRQFTEIMRRFGEELERNPRMLLFGRPGQPGPGE